MLAWDVGHHRSCWRMSEEVLDIKPMGVDTPMSTIEGTVGTEGPGQVIQSATSVEGPRQWDFLLLWTAPLKGQMRWSGQR